MRGKDYYEHLQAESTRITPAYAGKSFHRCNSFRPNQDHPRLCGEKIWGFLFLILTLGSPPPMRGKEVQPCICSNSSRITPAYAGKRHSAK